MHSYVLLAVLATGMYMTSALVQGAEKPLDYEIQLDTVLSGFNGEFCWFHPRAGSIPGMGKNGGPAIVMTLQKWFVSASDYFSGLSVMRTDDLGKTWTGPEERPELSWRPEGEGRVVGICDFQPGFHRKTGKLIDLGHTVRYENGKLAPEPRARATAYTVFDPKTNTWQTWREIEMPDKEKFFSAGAGCAQWLCEPDGSLLIPFYFRGRTNDRMSCYSATTMRCTFDGETISYVTHGDELKLDVPRGFCEPSITFFSDRYYMTLRNDVKGYVSLSDDGLHWAEPRPWAFDDGSELGSYNTQQHWVTHSDGLFLAYTRRGANNDHIPRNRAPLFIAQVDAEKLFVVRSTERILMPERGAMLGNFGVVTVNENETWVTDAEGMHPPENLNRGATGAVFAARVKWNKPNKLADRLN